jgi:hypothetical protein
LGPGSEIGDPGWIKIRIRDKHLSSCITWGIMKNWLYFRQQKYFLVPADAEEGREGGEDLAQPEGDG